MNFENDPIEWHDFTVDGPIPGRHTVISKWLPLIDDSGRPVLLNPNVDSNIFARLVGKHAEKMITASGSVTEMHHVAETDEWLPKIGAAQIHSKGLSVFAPHGQIRITASLDYSRAISIGVILHLGFEG